MKIAHYSILVVFVHVENIKSKLVPLFLSSKTTYDTDYRAKVVAAYVEEPNARLADLANRFGISSSTVREWSKKEGVYRYGRGAALRFGQRGV